MVFDLWFFRYLSSHCLWFVSSSSCVLPSSCLVCIPSVPICCSLCTFHVAFIWCCTGRSSLCSYSYLQTQKVNKGSQEGGRINHMWIVLTSSILSCFIFFGRLYSTVIFRTCYWLNIQLSLGGCIENRLTM